MNSRMCKTCGLTFPATTAFFRAASGCVGGISHKCLPCQRAYLNDYKSARAATISARRRAAYLADNGTQSKARESRRAARDPWTIRAQRMRGGMIERARCSGVPIDETHFSVPLLKIWIGNNRHCSCCGVEMVVAPGAWAKERNRTPTVDRIIPALGYVRGNVAILCWRCNNLKRDASADELQLVVNWIRRVSAANQAEAA